MEVLKQFLQAVVSAVSDSHEELKKEKKNSSTSLFISLLTKSCCGSLTFHKCGNIKVIYLF